MAFTRDMILDYVCSRLEEDGYSAEKNRLLEEVKEPIQYSASQKKLKAVGWAYEQSPEGKRFLTSTADTYMLTGDFAQERFTRILDQIFRSCREDDWNKIVHAICVTSRLVTKSASQENSRGIFNLTTWCIRYMSKHHDDWITSQGGWNSFLDYYPKGDTSFTSFFTSDEFKHLAGCGVAVLACVTVLRKLFGDISDSSGSCSSCGRR